MAHTHGWYSEQPGDWLGMYTTYVYLGNRPNLSGKSADMDGDGDLDLGNLALEAYLYRNDTETDNHWLRVKLKGREYRRDWSRTHPDQRRASAVPRTFGYLSERAGPDLRAHSGTMKKVVWPWRLRPTFFVVM